MSVRTAIDHYRFRGAIAPPAVASRVGEWCSKATGSATILAASGGAMELTLAVTTEVENGCLYMGDVLPYDIDDLIRVEFLAKIGATVDTASSLAFGLTGARNDAIDSIAQAALFRAIGNNTIVLETDDGTNEIDDGSSDGAVISTSYKRFAIDFASGLRTQSPPSASLGGKANVLFYVGNVNGSLRRVGVNSVHSLAAYTGNLQLFAQVQKTSADDVLTLSILGIDVEYKLPA